MPFRGRGRRLEEQIELMRRLWREPVVSFEGEFHRVTAAGLNPLPERRSIPIWIGAQAEPALRRAARLADGLMAQVPLDGDWGRTLELLRGWVAEAGRDPSAFGLEGRVSDRRRRPRRVAGGGGRLARPRRHAPFAEQHGRRSGRRGRPHRPHPRGA